MVHHPSLEPSTAFAQAVLAEREEEVGCSKDVTFPEKIGGGIVVDATHDTPCGIALLDNGTPELFTLKFRAKKAGKFSLRAIDGLLVDRNLGAVNF